MFAGTSQNATPLRCEQILSANHHVFTTAHQSGVVRRMTIEEFKAQIESIDPDTILVLDRLPAELDPPFVAGIITSEPLRAFGSHVHEMLRAIEAPLIYIPGAYQSETFKDLEGKRILIRTQEDPDTRRGGEFQIETRPRAIDRHNAQRSPRQSVLPVSGKRYNQAIISWEQSPFYPEFLTGQKFVPLSRARSVLPLKSTPDIVSMTTGFAERYKIQYIPFQHFPPAVVQRIMKRLRDHDRNFDVPVKLGLLIRSHLAVAMRSKDENEIREVLSDIQTSIHFTPMFPQNYDGEAVYKKLRQRFGNLDGPFAFRSNNDVEDYIGAGVYASSFGSLNSYQDLDHHLRSVISSLYSYRAFKLRRHFGLREENVSIAVMVHRKLTGEAMNGVSTFSPGADFPLELNAVRGSEERATNPSIRAESVQFSARNEGEIAFDESRFRPEEIRALTELIRLFRLAYDAEKKLQNSSDPLALKFEWILMPDPDRPGELYPVILQMKHALNVARRNQILYQLPQRLVLQVEDPQASAHPFLGRLRALDIKMHSLHDFLKNKMKTRRPQYEFPVRTFQTNEGDFFTAAWDMIPHPHHSTAGTARAVLMEGEKEAFIGYVQVRMSGIDPASVESVSIVGTGGSSHSMKFNQNRSEALRAVLSTLRQMPNEILEGDPIISISGLGSPLHQIPDGRMSLLENWLRADAGQTDLNRHEER